MREGTTMTLEPLLTAKEAADFLRTSVRTIYRACSNGDLDYIMVNERECRFAMGQLQAFVENHTVRAKTSESAKCPTDPGRVQEEYIGFLTEIDVASMLGISVRALRRLVKDKKLRSIRLTKRKQVFTRALIDEFLRGESGLNKMTPDGHIDPRFFGPQNSPISLEESRSLLKDLRKDMSPPDTDGGLIYLGRRR
jgi:excisionase family DNA binding protein